VFIDIERLRAGKFDESLLESVKQASSFIIVLTPNALDRCIGDDDRKDWVHKVRLEMECLHFNTQPPTIYPLPTNVAADLPFCWFLFSNTTGIFPL
jgi:hypothetical protein